MRIAIIAEVFLPKIDGVVHRTVNLIRELGRRGDEILVVCPSPEKRGACPDTAVAFPSFSFPLYPEYRIGLPNLKLARELERFAPDVVHYINPFAFGFRCYDVLKRAGVRVPSVFSFHTLYGEFVKQYPGLKPLSRVLWWMTREYHNRADVNITVSAIMREELVQRGFTRVECWPPAVDSRLFHPDRKSPAMRARLTPDDPDRPLLLTVSRLAPEKNVGFLAEILDRVPEAALAVVGDGPQRRALEQRFAGRRARFIGYLKGADLAAAYASADAFVYSSETETMGNVVLEAMACGCPVVAPRAGGIPSLVSHGHTALLYAPRDLDDAVRCTRLVLEDEALRTRLGQDARNAVAGWSWESSVEQVRQLYRDAIARFDPQPRRATKGHHVAQALTSGLVSTFQTVDLLMRRGGRLPSVTAPTPARSLPDLSQVAWSAPSQSVCP